MNDNKLGSFDFDLKKILKAHGKIKVMELRLSLGNYNGNNNSDSDLYFIFF